MLYTAKVKGGEMSVAEKRTQVYFPMELYRKVERIAKEESKSVASIVREAVDEYLKKREAIDWENDAFFNIVGIMESGKGDLAENHDKYLYGGGRKS
jgi:predicted DNA-binding protein